jgi:hypothetical protein
MLVMLPYFEFLLFDYSIFMVMGLIPVNMHSASPEVVQNSLAIFKLMSHCTRMYFCLLCWCFIASIYTGAPYESKGNIAPLYIVAIVPYLDPHVSVATLDRLCASFAHLAVVYFMLLEFKL